MMESIIIFIVGIFAAGVDSFSIPPSHLSKETTTLSRQFYSTAEATDEATATTFWGVPRSEEEIVDFVSRAVFNIGQSQDQWVEVISAEPPVRRIDFVLYF